MGSMRAAVATGYDDARGDRVPATVAARAVLARRERQVVRARPARRRRGRTKILKMIDCVDEIDSAQKSSESIELGRVTHH